MQTKTKKELRLGLLLFIDSYLKRKQEAKEKLTVLDLVFIDSLMKSLK